MIVYKVCKTPVLITNVLKIPHVSFKLLQNIRRHQLQGFGEKAVSKVSENVQDFNGSQVSLPFADHDSRKETEQRLEILPLPCVEKFYHDFGVFSVTTFLLRGCAVFNSGTF